MYSACACTVSCLACSTRFTAIRKSLLLATAVWTSPRSVSSWNISHHGRSAREAASAAACPRLTAGAVTTRRWYFGPTRHPVRKQTEPATRARTMLRISVPSFRRARFVAPAQPPGEVETNRDEQHGDPGSGRHAADHATAHHAPRDGAGPAGHPQRHTAQNEGEAGYQDGTQAQLGPLQRRIRQRHAAFIANLGELDDQDRVLRRQSNQH